jgi:hypothetical protein
MGEASKSATEHVLILQREDTTQSMIDDLREAHPDIDVTLVTPTSGKTIAELVPKGENEVFRLFMPLIPTQRASQKSSPEPPLS